MKVFKVTADILHDEQNFPVDFNCGAFGEGDSLEWHESLDLQLAKFNNVKVTENNIDYDWTIITSKKFKL